MRSYDYLLDTKRCCWNCRKYSRGYRMCVSGNRFCRENFPDEDTADLIALRLFAPDPWEYTDCMWYIVVKPALTLMDGSARG